MSNTTTKTFDAVQAVRTVRDEISAKILTMSVGEENRWLRSTDFSDPRLRRLMDLAAQQSAAADGAARRG
ncbi:MAG: hypothetical protein ABI051_00460 [Vicinamibacterales bacterium]